MYIYFIIKAIAKMHFNILSVICNGDLSPESPPLVTITPF